jgi:hypothetical protein
MFIGSHPFSSFSPGILVKIKKKKCWVFLLSAMASENICVQRRQKYYRSPDVERFAL